MTYKIDYWDSDAKEQRLRDATPEETAEIEARKAEAPAHLAVQARLAAIDDAIASDATVTTLKAMSNAEFSAWFTANVTTLAQARNVLERLARIVVRRVL
jgi:hypothetical protein